MIMRSVPIRGWCHFEGDITVLCVCSYLRYALSYRDREEIMSHSNQFLRHYRDRDMPASIALPDVIPAGEQHIRV
jgi:hypothetical protein